MYKSAQTLEEYKSEEEIIEIRFVGAFIEEAIIRKTY